MRKHFRKTLSTIFAIALLGCAVMLSVSSAEGPFRHASENAFNGPPLGHPDKALIHAQWLAECDVAPSPAKQTAFDWKLDQCDTCSKCGLKDSHVTPVVLDVPELMSPSDASAIEVIKRKLGINAFRGSIFEEPGFSAAQRSIHEAPAKAEPYVCESFSATVAGSAAGHCTTCEAFANGKAAATTFTAVKNGNEVCAHETCAAQGACCAEVAHSEKACNSDAASKCASESPANIGVATDWVTFNPRVQAFASTIAEDPVAALRRTSLDLDEAAMKLEVSDRYAEADALREAAQHLRIKARQFKMGPSVSTTKHSNASAVQATWYAPAAYCPESFIYPVTSGVDPAPSDQNAAPYCFQSPSELGR